jgi:hypothetical protein
LKPKHFVATTEKLRDKQDSSKRSKEVKAAKEAEIKQVFEEPQALELVEKGNIPPGIKALGCHLFTVEKSMASGEQDKYMSRLVLHGSEQDWSLYPDRPLPLVSGHAIMTCLAIAACTHEGR